jgi:hypothetical protein
MAKKPKKTSAEETPLLDPSDLENGTTITDLETGEVVDAEPSSIPGKSIVDEDTAPIRLGKKFRGEKFVTIKTAEMAAADAKLQKKYADPHAVTLIAYFVHKQIRNPVQQAGMTAYTRVRRATVQAFDEIFAKF